MPSPRCLAALVLIVSSLPASAASPDRFDELLEQARRDKRRDRWQAMINLRRLVGTRDLPRLHRALRTHTSWRARLAATAVVDDFRDPSSVRTLVDALRSDPHERVRRRAARALGRIGADRSVEPSLDRHRVSAIVTATRGDSSYAVRMHAAHALVELRGASARALLLQALVAVRTLEGQERKDVEAFLRQCITRVDAHSRLPPGRHLTRLAPLRPGATTEGWVGGSKYLLYTPSSYNRQAPDRGLSRNPLLVSVHGTIGVAEPYLDMCIADAERRRHLVLAPHFDYGRFPVYGDLTSGYGFDRSDVHLLDLVRRVGEQARIQVAKFDLFGHSQGGQFVHRFVLAYPDRIRRAAACASGYYVDPTADDCLPWGVQSNPLMPAMRFNFSRLVTSQLAIIVGNLDRAPGDDDPRRRINAARDFADKVRAHAARHGVRTMVSFRLPRGVAHIGRQTYPTAAESLYRAMWVLKEDF